MAHRFLLAAALAAGSVFVSTGNADLLAYDGFSNGPRANLAGSEGGTGWSGAWLMAGDNVTKIAGGGLVYPGLEVAHGGAATPVGGGVWPNSVYTRSFGPLPPGTTSIYASFLMRDDAAFGIWGGISFGTYPYEMTVGSPLGYYSYGLMISEGLGDVTNMPLIQGDTTLVVCKITKNAGAGITYRMFLNPTIGTPEPSFPDAIFVVAPVNVIPTAVSIDNGTGFTTDELRVGTTWASVLPEPPPPPVCLGDFNHTNMVDGADLAILLGNWGLPAGDLNEDQTTDASDLAILLGAWGACP
jgi:hypothetical protein